MNRTSINHSALVLSVAMATAWPLSPALADKGGTPHKDGVHPIFGLAAPSDGPFPSDRFSIADAAQNTCERVNLPMPADCVANKSTCIELGLVNQLDGFNNRPRIAIPFNGDIDLSTVKNENIFIVKLGDAVIDGAPDCLTAPAVNEDEVVPRPDAGWVVGIDQAAWDRETGTLYVEAAELLEQHTRYAVFVTRGVKDTSGEPIEIPKAFKKAIGDEDEAPVDPAIAVYEATLRRAVAQARFFGVKRHDIAVASVFTTLSVTAAIEKIRAATMATPPPAADFDIASEISASLFRRIEHGARAVFDLSKIGKITYNRHFCSVHEGKIPPSCPPNPSLPKFTDPDGNILSLSVPSNAILPLLRSIPGASPDPYAIKTLAFFRIQVPNYLQADATLVPFGTYSGTPKQFGTTDVYLELILPSGTPPDGGWPVVIWGYESSASGLNGSQMRVAAYFASQRIATLCWNPVGFGFGPASTVTVAQTGKPDLTFSFAGRSNDVDGDGNYDGDKTWLGVNERRILFDRDANRQTIADITQIIRAIEAGVDVDGVRLNPERVYYGGLSKGAVEGVLAAAVEPRFKAVALSSPNGFLEYQKVPEQRSAYLGLMLQQHVPSLINPPGTPVITQLGGVPVTAPSSADCAAPCTAFYNENMPDPGQPPLVNTIAGALEIQEYFERLEWLNANNAAGAFMEYLGTKSINPPARPVLIQMARGDRTTVNPNVAEGIRFGMLADRVTLYRHDLFVTAPSTVDRIKKLTPAEKLSLSEPHAFLVGTDTVAHPATPSVAALMKDIAHEAQDQIAAFFNSKDKIPIPIDPDGAGSLFETPAVLPNPMDFGFIFLP